MTEYTVVDLTGIGMRVEFVRLDHRDAANIALWYRVIGTNFLFPVPLPDTEGAEWLAEDDASLFRTWIRGRLTLYKQRDVAEFEDALK